MDDYEEFEEKKKQGKRFLPNFSAKIKPHQIFVIAILLFLLDRLIKSSENPKYLWWFGGAIIALYLYSIMQKETEKKLIPRHVAQDIALHDLIKDIGQGKSYPLGTQIHPTGYCRLQNWDAGDGNGPRPFSWNIGFKIKVPGKAEVEKIFKIHPFLGEPTGIKEAPSGFLGDDIRDIQVIYPEKVLEEKK